MSRYNPLLVESLEAIAYQNNDWVIPAMNAIWERYQTGKVDFKTTAKEWNTLVKKRFGIIANLVVDKRDGTPDDEVENAYCCTPKLADASTLFGGLWQGYVEYQKFMTDNRRDIMIKIAKGDLTPTGLLDYKKVKVGGLFANIKIEFGIGLGLLKNFPAGVVTAIMLHEIGHAWTFFEYMGVATFRNAVIANAVKEVLEKPTVEEKVNVIIDSINPWGLEIDPQTTAKLNDENATVVIVGGYERVFTHDVGYVAYNENTVEILADQFAARFGVGRLLSDFLGRNSDRFSVLTKQVNKHVSRSIVICVTAAMAAVASGAVAVSIPAIAGLGSLGMLVFGLVSKLSLTYAGNISDAAKNIKLGGTTYDEDKRRMERVLNETVGALKDPNIPKPILKQIIEEINIIISYINKAKTFEPYILKIAGWLDSEYRSQKAKMVYQQMVEDMLANQLFVTAGKLKTLG